MLDPKTIIELDYQFDNEQIEELKKFLDKYYNITNHDIEIFDAKNYALESDFTNVIFEEVGREMAEDY